MLRAEACELSAKFAISQSVDVVVGHFGVRIGIKSRPAAGENDAKVALRVGECHWKRYAAANGFDRDQFGWGSPIFHSHLAIYDPIGGIVNGQMFRDLSAG